MPIRPSTLHPGIVLRPVLAALLDVALPVECPGCGAAGSRCCAGCRAVLATGAPGPWRPSPVPAGFPPTWSALPYAGVTRACIVAWKDGDRADLTRLLAPVLARSLSAALTGRPSWASAVRDGTPVLVVPAPSARGSTRRRGREPLRDLCRAVLCRTERTAPGLRGVSSLTLNRRVRDQAGLGREQRADNLSGAMVVSPRHRGTVAGAHVVVVDDVVTTGATLAEAARALAAAEAADVVAVTIAATRRHAAAPERRAPLPAGRDRV
jgi:predicted amidophosphoribosyltransferase